MTTPDIQASTVTEHLAQVPAVEGVCLFGSYARGTQVEVTSDVDILVLGASEKTTLRDLRHTLSRAGMDHPRVALSYHTPDSLSAHLRRWSRFAAHLRTEGRILYDPSGRLAGILAEAPPVSTHEEILALHRHLESFGDLDGFGNRYLFVLARLHRVGRSAVYALLAEDGVLSFDREEAFAAYVVRRPEHRDAVETVARLRPFADAVRNEADGPYPFDPVGCRDEVVRARDAVHELLRASVHADALPS